MVDTGERKALHLELLHGRLDGLGRVQVQGLDKVVHGVVELGLLLQKGMGGEGGGGEVEVEVEQGKGGEEGEGMEEMWKSAS